MDTCVKGGATVITEGCKQEPCVPSQPTSLQSLCDDPLLLQDLVVREKLREFDQDIHLESPLIEPCLLVEWNRLRRVFSSGRVHFRLKERDNEKPLVLVMRPSDGMGSSLISNTVDIRDVKDLKKMPSFVNELLVPQESTKDSGGYSLINYDPFHGWILLGCLSSMETSPTLSPLLKNEHTADDDVDHFNLLKMKKEETKSKIRPQTVVYCSTDELGLPADFDNAPGEKTIDLDFEENAKNADDTLPLAFAYSEDENTISLASPPLSPILKKAPFQEKRSNFKVYQVCETCNQEVLKELLSLHMAKHDPSNWIRCAYCDYMSYEVDDIKKHTAKMHEDEHDSIHPPTGAIDSTTHFPLNSNLSTQLSNSPLNITKTPSTTAFPAHSARHSTPEIAPKQLEPEKLDSPIIEQPEEIPSEVHTPITPSRTSLYDLELSPLAYHESFASPSKRVRFKSPSPEIQSRIPRRLVTLFSSEATEVNEEPDVTSPLTRSKSKSLSPKAQSQMGKSLVSETSETELDNPVAMSNSTKKKKSSFTKRQPSKLSPLVVTLSSVSDCSRSEATDSPKKKKKKSANPRFKKNTSDHDCFTSLSDQSQSEETPVERVTRSRRNSQLPSSKSKKFKKEEGSMLLRCDICYKTFNFRRSFEVHMESHDPLKKKQCNYCPYSTSLGSDLRKHIRIRHPDVSDLSLEPIVSSDSVSDIASSSSHSDPDEDNCSEESFLVLTTSDSKSSSSPSSSDMREEPNVSSTRRKWLLCPHCDYKSQRADYYQIHVDVGHPDMKKTLVRSAGKKSGSSSSSFDHTPKCNKLQSRMDQTSTSDSSNRTPKRDAAAHTVTALCPTCDEKVPVAVYIQHVANHRMINRNNKK